MSIISVGYTFEPNDQVINCSFSSSYSFLNCDILYIDPSNILTEYYSRTNSPTYMGYKNLNDDSSVSVVNDITRRKNEIIELLKMGKTIFLTISKPQIFYRATGEKQYSGTGRNRTTTRIVTEGDILSFLPVNLKAIEATGANIEFKGDEKYRSFWESIKDLTWFTSYIDKPLGNPFLFVKGTNKVIACHDKYEQGNIIFIPSLLDNENFKTKKDLKQTQNIYLTAFEDIRSSLRNDMGVINLPAWTFDYYIPTEKKEKLQLLKLETKLVQLKQQIAKKEQQIGQIQEWKLLWTESGQILEKLVNKLLTEIGFTVTEGVSGRDDLILQYEDKVAVVEVKGLTKSAAEKHAAQLEKWVNEYFTSKSIFPKGILIVNPFRDTPLIERTEDTFPSQMIGFSQRRGHCLISTMQLLFLYFDTNKNPDKRHQQIEKLFKTEGIFDDYHDWKSYIDYEIQQPTTNGNSPT